jgi:hypothetical protein
LKTDRARLKESFRLLLSGRAQRAQSFQEGAIKQLIAPSLFIVRILSCGQAARPV